MRALILFIVLIISLIGNLILLYQHIELTKEVEKLKGPYMYQKAQNDIEVFFDKIEGKKDKKQDSTAVDKKEEKPVVAEKIEENNKPEISLVKADESTDKNTYVNYGVFSTEHFINENVKKLKSKNIPFTLKERKKGTQILIGPLTSIEAQELLKQSFIPKDARIVNEK
jgi:hypothetical protein